MTVAKARIIRPSSSSLKFLSLSYSGCLHQRGWTPKEEPNFMPNIVEVENAMKIAQEAINKWSPIQFATKKKELEKANVLADQVLDKKWEELKDGAPAEAKEAAEKMIRLREEANQLFQKAAKMFKVELAKEASAKYMESWQEGLKAVETATAAKV